MLITQDFTVRTEDKVILKDITVEFAPGIHVIMGRNGIGKSSFAQGLMGHYNYTTEGAVEFYGKDLLAMETHEKARAGLFVGFQHPSPVPGLSNFQLLKSAKQSMGNSFDIVKELSNFKKLSNQFSLPDDWDKRHVNVDSSGGEKKKNELIQLSMLKPKCAILDEPDSGLDVDGIRSLTTHLHNFVIEDPERVLIIITHYQPLIDSLSINSTTIISKNKAIQEEGKDLAYKVLEDGFENFV
jgi:Fe-S cluster assembly ATP-binding protein